VSDESAFSDSSNKLFSSASIKTILKNVPAGLLILLKPDGRIVYVNDRAIELYGVDPRELVVNSNDLCPMKHYTIDGKICPPDKLPARHALVTGERVRNEELIIERHDGSRIHVNASAVPLTNKGGEVTGALAIFEDVTERKKTEELYRSLLDTSFDSFWLADADGHFLDVNEAFLNLSGYSREEILGMSISDVEAKETAEDTAKHLQKIKENGFDYFETLHRRKDGRVIEIQASANYAEIDGGRYFGFLHNITKRKQNEAAIRRSEEQFRRAVENAPIPIVMQAEDGEVLQVNHAWIELTGYNLEDVPSFDAWLNIAYGEGAEDVSAHMHNLFDDGKNIIGIEFPICTRDGKIRYWNFSASLLGTLQDKRRFAIGMAVDITQLKQLQGKLEQHAKKLEELVRIRTERLKATERLATIGETAGMVGHDIRNPLQSIVGELYLLNDELGNLHDGDAKKSLKESVAVIEEQTAYINKIVTDLQDYARPAAPRMEEVDVDKAIQTAISNMDIPENIEFSCYVQSGFPKLRVDHSFLKRILTNLISNAVQAMPDGGKLTITTSVEDEKALISVEDTGGGIPEENREKMFKPLFTTKSKGQGFGLAVCKKLTEAMNGTITFDSQAGKGTRFTVQLPTS
jgi:PAS domain S-box-containing protein